MTKIDPAGEARKLLEETDEASITIEVSVQRLVEMRAWEVLGYKDFSEMWEQERHYETPTYVQVLAVAALANEGMNTRNGMAVKTHGPDGHTYVQIAEAIGLTISTRTSGTRYAPVVGHVIKQLEEGVPPGEVKKKHTGTVSRAHSQRIGKGPDELVQTGITLPRRDADAVAEIARKADVPNTEIYRQAVAEYLVRYRESRP